MGDMLKPKYSKYNKYGVKDFRRYLNQQLDEGGRATEQQYRADTFNIMDSQRRESDRVGGQVLGSSFGWNNPTGLESALKRRTALAMDYAGANIAAKNAARAATIQVGRELEGSKQRQANWYSTLAAPYLSEQGTLAAYAAQEAAAEGQEDAAKYQLIGSIIGGVGGALGAI